MKTLRYWFRFIITFVNRFKVILFFGIIIGILFFAFLQIALSEYVFSPKTYIGIIGRYHTDDLPIEITNLISQGLTQTNSDGTISPAIAKEWQRSDDGKKWVIKLNENYTWHDGTSVTSDNINYNFNGLTIEKNDDYTITFILENTYSPFLTVLSKPVFKKNLIGVGEWKVKNIKQRSGYINELILENTQNNIKRIYKFYPSEERAKTDFKLGKIDILLDLSDSSPFETWPNLTIEKNTKTNRVVVIFFNTTSDILGGKEIRQALSYAIDKNLFNKTRAISPISETSWAFNPQVKTYDFDSKRAKELIEDLPTEQIANFELKLVSSPNLINTAEIIKKYWEDVGIKVNLSSSPFIPDEFDAFLATYEIPSDPDQYGLWHSTQTTTNISKYNDPRIDKLLEDGRLELSEIARKKIYLDFQRFLLEDAPAIFLYYPESINIIRN